MWRILFVWISVFILDLNLAAQGKFVSIFDFNACGTKDVSGRAGDISPAFPLMCECGVDNDAAKMDANSLEMDIRMDSLYKSDITICFDVLIDNLSGEVDLLSKVRTCNSDTAILISYRVIDSTYIIILKEGLDESYILFAKADKKSCWQSLCLSIIGGDIRFYVNGKESANLFASDRLRLDNGIPLSFNGSDCQNNNVKALKGRLDRIIFANYGFNREEVNKYYREQQKIITQDTIIFLGDQFSLRAESNCPSSVNWSPAISLNDPTLLQPIASPVVDTKYSTVFSISNCRIYDTVLVRVVDKSKLECANISLPSAFTPNNDNLNDEFFISNPYIISKLNYFEILDRNGSVFFSTSDPLAKWNGTFKSKELNSGTFYYRIEYECKDETYKNRGSFMLMR